ncbi:MAG: 50S ribosomal protein L25 [Deltaproteobacteria bacterium]|nr:50S ribosomal protein L25 [Deltaproteobacteria bacterium]
MAQMKLSARIRDKKGKGAARKLREEKKIPAILYGPETAPLMLTVKRSDMEGILKKTMSDNVILSLEIKSNGKSETRTVMLKELQTDILKDHIVHIDFHEITMNTELTVEIPITLIGTPIGATNGGILQSIRRELTVTCLADKLIENIELDVTELDIGESLHVKDIKVPEGIRILDEDHHTVVVVSAPTVQEVAAEEEEVEEEAAEETGAESEETGPEES